MNVISKNILSLINPPDCINSWERLNEIINDKSCLTVIEMPFYSDVKKIINEIIQQNIDGDIVIAGLFKGGSALYLKALFEEAGIFKKWWLLDSFKGFNIKTIKHTKDIKSLNKISNSLIKLEQPTAANILKLFKDNNLDSNVEILEGYFEDIFSFLKIDKISLLHIDVDFYEPTLLCLNKFYPALQTGGFVVIDDYYVEEFNCKKSVDDYRVINQITAPIIRLGNYPICWKKDNINIRTIQI